MTKRFAVAFISMFDNDLTIEIVTAPDWLTAIKKHTKTAGHMDEETPATLEKTKELFFNQDAAIDVAEIPEC